MGLHTVHEIESVGFGAYWAESARQIPNKGDLSTYWIGISSARDFLITALSYTFIMDLMLRLCHRLIACSIVRRSQAPEKVTLTDLFYLSGMDVGSVNTPYLLVRYLRLFASGRKSGARLSEGHFIGRLAQHFGLVSDDGLRGLSVVTSELPFIDMGYSSTHTCTTTTTPTAGRSIPKRLGILEDEIQGLRQDVGNLHGHVERLMTNQGRFSTWMISCMTQLMEASGRTNQTFDGTFRGSYPVVFEKCTRQRTDSASTSTA
ncbi:hypothetical protein Tco_0829369 [Tanacetum coccineum]